jgi:purine-nucleoside phosphorylase
MTGAARDAAAQVAEAVQHVGKHGFGAPFDLALVLGTGLGPVADLVEDARSLPYASIPHFPRTGVSGHRGRLLAGRLAGRCLLILDGRAHAYEHGDAGIMRVPIGLVAALGAPPLLLTNAAGSTLPASGPGSLVLVTDHINLSGMSPLLGEAGDARFVAMHEAYDPGLRARLQRAASAAGIALGEGVYAWFSGPHFETPAEIRMARLLGAGLVGMSTVPEVILARFHGLRVAALSVVTNWAAGLSGGAPSHAETQAGSAAAARDVGRLLIAALSEPGDV